MSVLSIMKMFKVLLTFYCTICAASKQDIENLLYKGGQHFSRYSPAEQQDFVNTFSQLVLAAIEQKIKTVRLSHGYAIFNYGITVEIYGTLHADDGVSSKPLCKHINTTIVEYVPDKHLMIDTWLDFNAMRLSYTNCTLNMLGMSVHGGNVAAHTVASWQGRYSTAFDFKHRDVFFKRMTPHLTNTDGDRKSVSYVKCELELPANSTDLFDIFLHLAYPETIQMMFSNQLAHVFDVDILHNVQKLYQSL